jgi:Fe2+ transport system protein FeoA
MKELDKDKTDKDVLIPARQVRARRRTCGYENLSQDGTQANYARLGDLEPGSKGIIKRLSCRGKLRRRLMDMGIVAGIPVEVIRVAPLGDPVELKIKDFNLSLRREEAGSILVEVLDEKRE